MKYNTLIETALDILENSVLPPDKDVIKWLVNRHGLKSADLVRRQKDHWEYFTSSRWWSAGTDQELAFYIKEDPHFLK